jgi:putative MATE family efflux protein
VTTTSEAKFLTGSTLRHIVVMTSTASIGLMTLFLVDLADMYFLSLLGEVELASAVGYGGTVLFFTTSICIGLMIAMSALVSRAIGAGDGEGARVTAANVLAYSLILTSVIAIIVWFSVPWFLSLLGAGGRAHLLAGQYLRIVVPSMPILALAMGCTGLLRARGDAKRAMYATVAGGLVNAVLDPIFIFTLGLGIQGAAIASVIARVAVVFVALYGVLAVHKALSLLEPRRLFSQLGAISAIAVPAMLTSIATPIGNAFVTAAMAPFGDGAMAGLSIIGRVTPVALGAIFALTGAIGPIVGQNFGAGDYGRVRRSLSDALLFISIYVATVSLALYLLRELVISAFRAGDDAAWLISIFCTWVAITFLFNGALFVANAAFNNLGRPGYSTVFNFAKATLGTIPLVYLGALVYGAAGVLIGQAIGSVLFGTLAIMVAFRFIRRLAAGDTEAAPKATDGRRAWPFPLWPQTTQRG